MNNKILKNMKKKSETVSATKSLVYIFIKFILKH